MRALIALLIAASALTPVATASCVRSSSWGQTTLSVAAACVRTPTPTPWGTAESAPAATESDTTPPRRVFSRCIAGDDFRDSCNQASREYLIATTPDQPAPATEAPAAATALTISDLAAFTPAVGELVTQPDGWAVAGRPTNFIATATTHTQEGTLLGTPVQIRWRPVAFTFDYGDGTSNTTTTGGATWPTTDDEWTDTETSHVYESRGPITASVAVEFAADITTPDSAAWAPVQGTLTLAAPDTALHVYEVRTVLTRGNCIQHPDDPGCP